MNTKNTLILLKKHLVFILTAGILAILLFRNPYSIRTLIPNLEPFPDALYYTTTPRCFLNGQDWRMCRINNSEISGIGPSVPPAYSISLLPAYIVNQDVRTFYFSNILLSFISLALLYKISQNFFNNQYITGTILFLYVTNYFVYWYPTLAMAENLLIPLFLTSILLLQQKKLSHNTSIFAGILATSFYGTKYAFAPLTVAFPIVYLLRLFFEKKTLQEKISHFTFLTIPAGLIMLNLVGVKQLLTVINETSNGALDSTSAANVSSGNGFFSKNYFTKHIFEYSKGLLGKSQRFLWDNTPLTEQWLALSGLFGLLIGLKEKKYYWAKIWLVVAVVSQLLFISLFYVVDIRYVYHFLPILLLGFGFFLHHLQNTLLKKKTNFFTFIIVILAVYLAGNIIRLKSTVMVNLKYAETPWWYLSQVEMNNYFDNITTDNSATQPNTTKPILITLSAPFLTDNYTNNNYTTLPLNDQQDFRGNMPNVWGPNNYENLIALYNEKVESGHQIFVTNYGVNATGSFKASFAKIEKNFNLIEVQTGCHNLCNIYMLEPLP